ncbi:TPA: hypothetical protein MXV08_004053 [Pseudomonas aeruginosa]|nr:hypothetical protein [Pseudomonas aeruginosa]KSC76936.1 hypothetical protein AO888_02985 [Pseudomonas aeruginosa]HCA5884932.1 hypothetical protein [Pseudomonas aeruginosa]HCA6578195.1 hypothetical protein [Pseudomonas aeruginosa]HCA6932481.1 hypothetical protein [Pseudomonas aeruginosa]HCA7561299.1 hypothetical protein [Pseudomonas aeruginosa]
MHEFQIGQARYVQSGFQLYHHSEAVVEAASKAEWAEGVLTENNVWLSPEHMQADVANSLVGLAKSTLAHAEEILGANLYTPVLVRPERPLNPSAEAAPAEGAETLLFQFVERGSLAALTPLEVVTVQRGVNEPDQLLEFRARCAYMAEAQHKVKTMPIMRKRLEGRDWCLDSTLV